MERYRLSKVVPAIVGVCTVLVITKIKKYPPMKKQSNLVKQLREQTIKYPYQSALLFEKRVEQTFKQAHQKIDSIYNFACQLEGLIEQIKIR